MLLKLKIHSISYYNLIREIKNLYFSKNQMFQIAKKNNNKNLTVRNKEMRYIIKFFLNQQHVSILIVLVKSRMSV